MWYLSTMICFNKHTTKTYKGKNIYIEREFLLRVLSLGFGVVVNCHRDLAHSLVDLTRVTNGGIAVGDGMFPRTILKQRFTPHWCVQLGEPYSRWS